MVRLPSRQVHLDFHTSEAIPGVGSRFDKRQFQQALKLGRLNSITVFAKCHHGWCYYPTAAGAMHPTLDFDLTGAMLEAAHEIGVRAPVYITVGWSAKDAEDHPEWVARDRDGNIIGRTKVDGAPDEPRPYTSWKFLCVGSGYEQTVYAVTREVCERYARIDGLFFDINFRPVCWCDACRAGMKRAGLDPDRDEDAARYNTEKWRRFAAACRAIVLEAHPEATVFFNGSANVCMPEFHDLDTHYELEDLPTTWGGYDKMPLRARFFRRTGKDYLGMTGKFHTSWGEFGGFKNPEALRFECAWMLANGARCSVGDQMHPLGAIDPETYRLIGHAYEYVEKIERWCFDAQETTRLGVLLSGDPKSDEGLTKVLLEAQLDFDMASAGDDLGRYDALVLPDAVRLDDDSARDLAGYLDRGGALLLTGTSGLDRAGARFLLDVGARHVGGPIYENDFVQAGPSFGQGLIGSPVLFYEAAQRTSLAGGEPLADVYEPYFDRTFAHYCSHRNTPNRPEKAEHPAAVRKGNVVYLAHPVFRLYFQHGMQFYRDYALQALRLIYRDPVLRAKMPSCGRARLLFQPKERRYVLHLLYAAPIQRGGALVLEDMPPLCDVPVSMTIAEKVRRACLAPEGRDIPFRQAGSRVTLTVPEVRCHQLVALEV